MNMNNKRLVAEIVNGEEVVMTIDNNMLSCEFGALDRGNLTDVVNWGIYANRGSLSFIDNVGYFNNQNVNSSEVKNYTVKFYLMKSQKSLIATFKIDSVDFEEETREVNIELVSKILSLQKEKTVSSVYPFYSKRLSELMPLISEVLPYSNVVAGEDVTNFSNISIGCPYIGIDTAWNVLTKICQASMSRLVEAENGDLQLTSSFPERIPIIVEPNNIISIDKGDFVRVENARIDVTKRKTYIGATLDGLKSQFSIKRDNQGRFTEVEGVENAQLRVVDEYEYSIYNEYLSGKLRIKTPYKIYRVHSDSKSTVDERTTVYNLRSSPTSIISDRNYSRRQSMCSNFSIVNDTDIYADMDEKQVTYQHIDPENSSTEILVNGGTFSFNISTFIDEGTSTYSIKENVEDAETIESNDLIQIDSYYGEIQLGNHILEEVKKRYSQGIECFEIECLFNDYHYVDGTLAYSTNNLSTHFQKYDVIIPYVMKKGQRVPLRVNADGTPKKFRIIGISYSYDGLLRQKLSVQEERYDVD